MDTVNTELIRGHVDTIILNSLAERDRYGYEILDIISDLSEGRYEIKQPTLYSCLKRLEKQGFISSYFGDESNGGRRRYYQLTEKGRETLEQDQREWEFSRTIINKLLSDKEIDLKTVEAPFDPNELRPLTRRVRAHEKDDEVAATIAQEPIVKYVYVPQYVHVPVGQPLPENPPLPEGAILEESNLPKDVVVEEIKEEYCPSKEDAINALYSTNNQEIKEEVQQECEPIQEEIKDEEELFIIEQQAKASKLLQIGEFAMHRNLLEEDTPSSVEDEEISNKNAQNGQESTTLYNSYVKEKPYEQVNYKEALSAIFGTAEPTSANLVKEASASYKAETERLENSAKARHFGDVKQSLYEDGFKLKVYQKANSINHYYMKFIYSNRINRDTALLTYLVLLAELLIMIIAKKAFGAPLTYIIIGSVGLLIPIIPTLIWLTNPTKRIRAQFNLNQTLANAVIAFLVISAIAIVVSLLLSADMKSGATYSPIIISSNIPVGVLIYGVLYKSNNYHLKK